MPERLVIEEVRKHQRLKPQPSSTHDRIEADDEHAWAVEGHGLYPERCGPLEPPRSSWG